MVRFCYSAGVLVLAALILVGLPGCPFLRGGQQEVLLKASFTVSNSTPPPGEVVFFRDLSETSVKAGPIVAHLWDFGDGSFSTETNPSHVYVSTGQFSVVLSVQTAKLEQKASRDVYVTAAQQSLVANFEADPTQAGVNDVIHFTDRSVANATEPIQLWDWDFGDNVRLNGMKQGLATHQYAQPGVYTVKLTVYTASRNETAIRTNYIKVTAPKVLTANFSAENTESIPGLPVRFFDLSTPGSYPITKWEWWFDYQGGQLGTPNDTAQNPSHYYSSVGTYAVLLRVTTTDRSTSQIQKSVKVSYIPPTADFVADNLEPLIGESVQFTDRSDSGAASSIAAWQWNFGDGTTSSARNPMHAYTRKGPYTVSLTITVQLYDEHGAPLIFTDEALKSIHVLTAPPPPPEGEGGGGTEGEGGGGTEGEGGGGTEGEGGGGTEGEIPLGDIIYVGPTAANAGTGLRTLTKALQRAQAGNVLMLEHNVVFDLAYGETFPLVLKPGVTIRGEDSALCVGTVPSTVGVGIPITDTDNQRNWPAISGNSSTPTFVLADGGSTATFENVVIENSGVAIAVTASKLAVKNCIIQYFVGTAISASGADCKVTIEDSYLRASNWLTNGGYVEIGPNTNVIVRRCLFAEPIAWYGGGFAMGAGSTLLAEDTYFDDGWVTKLPQNAHEGLGGILYAVGATSATFKRCTFHNSQSGDIGGAIYFIPGSGAAKSIEDQTQTAKAEPEVPPNPKLEIEGCLFDGSSSGFDVSAVAGAIYIAGTADQALDLIIRQSVFSHCESSVSATGKADGGAISAFRTVGTITDTDFVGNQALTASDVTFGGAVAVLDPAGDWVFDNCKFSDNHCAFLGGALWFDGLSAGKHNLILKKCLFNGNYGASGTGVELPVYGKINSQSVFSGALSMLASDCYFIGNESIGFQFWGTPNASVLANNVFVGNEIATLFDTGSSVIAHNLWAFNSTGIYDWWGGTVLVDTDGTDTTFHNSGFVFNRGVGVFQAGMTGAPVLINCSLYYPGGTEVLYSGPNLDWESPEWSIDLYSVDEVNQLWGCENNIEVDPQFPTLYSGMITSVKQPGTPNNPLIHAGTGMPVYGLSEITVSGAGWTPDAFAGAFFFPDNDFFGTPTSIKQFYIVSNTADRLYVLGDVVEGWGSAGVSEFPGIPGTGDARPGQAFVIWDIRVASDSLVGGAGSDWPLTFEVPDPLRNYVSLKKDIDGNDRGTLGALDIGPYEFMEAK